MSCKFCEDGNGRQEPFTIGRRTNDEGTTRHKTAANPPRAFSFSNSASPAAAVPCMSRRSTSTTLFFAFGSFRFLNMAAVHSTFPGATSHPADRVHQTPRQILHKWAQRGRGLQQVC